MRYLEGRSEAELGIESVQITTRPGNHIRVAGLFVGVFVTKRVAFLFAQLPLACKAVAIDLSVILLNVEV